jgi:RecA/RadA recombinase
MAKQKEEKVVVTPEMQAQAYLKANAKDHYNFEDDVYYKVPSSSLILNDVLKGGIPTGAHRFVGINSGGKTSCSLDFMMHFLQDKREAGRERRGVYFKCEGRLSPEIQARSGVKFTNKADEWKDGACLVFESNIFETIFGFMHEMVVNNPQKTQYFFIVDSVDNMICQEDMAKPLGKAQRVSAGAVITSVFLKKTGLALCKRGHVAIFISQIRDTIPQPYTPPPPRQGKSSGGHAIEHNANIVIDFLSRSEKHLIREGVIDEPEAESGEGGEESKEKLKSPIIGHWCRIKFIKTDNEKNGVVEQYPIKYGRVNGTSVWREYEIVKKMKYWQLVEKSASWFIFKKEILEDVRKVDPEFPEKIQGEDSIRAFLEEKPAVTNYLYEKFSVTSDI